MTNKWGIKIKKSFIILLLLILMLCACQHKELEIWNSEKELLLYHGLGYDMDSVLRGIQNGPIVNLEESNEYSNDMFRSYSFSYSFAGIEPQVSLLFFKPPGKKKFALVYYTQLVEFADWPNEVEQDALSRIINMMFATYGTASNGETSYTFPKSEEFSGISISWNHDQTSSRRVNLSRIDQQYVFAICDIEEGMLEELEKATGTPW